MGWLSIPENGQWLLIFDNVDCDHRQQSADDDAYDLTRYFPEADHGSILITTRLAKLEQLGTPWKLNRVDEGQARAIFQKWYNRRFGILL
jgi:hypothetical protein